MNDWAPRSYECGHHQDHLRRWCERKTVGLDIHSLNANAFPSNSFILSPMRKSADMGKKFPPPPSGKNVISPALIVSFGSRYKSTRQKGKSLERVEATSNAVARFFRPIYCIRVTWKL